MVPMVWDKNSGEERLLSMQNVFQVVPSESWLRGSKKKANRRNLELFIEEDERFHEYFKEKG